MWLFPEWMKKWQSIGGTGVQILHDSKFAGEPTFLCDQPPLSCLSIPLPSPTCPTPALKQSSITLIPPCYPLLNLPPPSWPIQLSGSFWLAVGPPNPVAVSHLAAAASRARADSSMSKSIIIFGLCNPIPEDILQRAALAVMHIERSCRNVVVGEEGKRELRLRANQAACTKTRSWKAELSGQWFSLRQPPCIARQQG